MFSEDSFCIKSKKKIFNDQHEWIPESCTGPIQRNWFICARKTVLRHKSRGILHRFVWNCWRSKNETTGNIVSKMWVTQYELFVYWSFVWRITFAVVLLFWMSASVNRHSQIILWTITLFSYPCDIYIFMDIYLLVKGWFIPKIISVGSNSVIRFLVFKLWIILYSFYTVQTPLLYQK